MARKRQRDWTTQGNPPPSPALVRRINERLAASPDSATAIFRSEQLARYCSLRTFQLYARRRRAAAEPEGSRDQEREGDSDPQILGPAAPTDVIDAAIAEMQRQLDGGLVKNYVLPNYVRSMQGLLELKLKQSAEVRAAELHAQKLAELRTAQDGALDDVSQAVQLTEQQVAQIREKVLGLVALPREDAA